MTHWSSGQDATLSRWNQGFDSPMGYQNFEGRYIPSFLLINENGGKNGL